MKKIISKRKIKQNRTQKTNPDLQQTITLALKYQPWLPLAKILAGPTRRHAVVNLDEIDSQAKEGDTILVPGKILAVGDLSKKIRICSLGMSSAAKEKIKKSKSEAVLISEEIKKNTKAEGIRILQ